MKRRIFMRKLFAVCVCVLALAMGGCSNVGNVPSQASFGGPASAVTVSSAPDSSVTDSSVTDSSAPDSSAAGSSAPNSSAAGSEAAPGGTSSGGAAAGVSEEAAKDIALADAGVSKDEAQRLTLERDTERGEQVYEIEFYLGAAEYDYTVRISDGSILEFKWEGADSAASEGDIGSEAAKAAAFAHAGVSQGDRLELKREYKYGKLTYELEFYFDGTEYEYEIDGASGGVLKHSAERD